MLGFRCRMSVYTDAFFTRILTPITTDRLHYDVCLPRGGRLTNEAD